MSAGKFSIAELFKHLSVLDGARQSANDKLIWKVVTPQRVRVFLWLLIRGRLLTNEERAKARYDPISIL